MQQQPAIHNPHQLLVPLVAPMPVQLQNLQNQMGVMQSVPGWQQQHQANQWRPPPQHPLTEPQQYPANGMMQPPYNSYGGFIPPVGSGASMYPPPRPPTQDGVDWRGDVHRSG